MKLLCLLLLSLCMVSCTDYSKVMKQYKDNNPHAKDLLSHGFNMKNSEYISTECIERSLKGDEEAKSIVYAQIDTLKGVNSSSSHVYPVVVPMNAARR